MTKSRPITIIVVIIIITVIYIYKSGQIILLRQKSGGRDPDAYGCNGCN